jgi:hypothetical protein
MAESRVASTDFTWSHPARRYRDAASGRFVPQGQVHDALDAVLDGAAGRARDAAARLASGQITVAQWQREMTAVVKDSQLAGTAVGGGGWHQLSAADHSWAEQRIREQLDYLRGFADQLDSGVQCLDGTLEARAAMYGNAGRATQREMDRRLNAQAGQQFERRALGPADHCPDCLDAAARDWQPIGTLPRIGNSACATNCRCVFEFSMTDAGDGAADQEAA